MPIRPFSHIHIAHMFWKEHIILGDKVIDATAGNGHDSLFLATLLLKDPSGHLIAFDIQKTAIENTLERLKDFPQNQIDTYNMCHSRMHEVVQSNSIKLIVFNLGYLPGGDKALTTNLVTTLTAIKTSLELVVQGGLVSITCYPGHDEGLIEEKAILEFCATLDSKQWSISSHTFLNRQRYPHLLLLQRII